MAHIIKSRMFTIATLAMALVFWFFDAVIHHFVYGEPEFEYIPSDLNELWMRTVIVIMILLFGMFADYFTNKIMFKEKQLEVAHVYSAMLQANQHILSNIINQMELFKLEAKKSTDFDRDVIELYDNTIKEASDLVDTLARLRHLSGDMGEMTEKKTKD